MNKLITHRLLGLIWLLLGVLGVINGTIMYLVAPEHYTPQNSIYYVGRYIFAILSFGVGYFGLVYFLHLYHAMKIGRIISWFLLLNYIMMIIIWSLMTFTEILSEIRLASISIDRILPLVLFLSVILGLGGLCIATLRNIRLLKAIELSDSNANK